MDKADLDVFETARPSLLGLAYRILGSRADAEDAVQDCFLKWSAADRNTIAKPAAWLSTICTRRCLDVLRGPNRARVDYVGPWLPEPIQMAVAAPDADGDLAASLTTAFLLMLERLTPKERAAYLLHEIFDQPYEEIADALEMTEPACRQLVARAKTHIDQRKVRQVTPAPVQDRLLSAFQSAISSGDASQLSTLLSADIRLTADGGGKVSAAARVLQGHEVMLFLKHAHRWWEGYTWNITHMSGGRGAILSKDGQPMLTLSFDCDETGRIDEIFIMRNPDKLAHLDPVAIH